MRILVVGTGYVGLVTGTCLSDLGHSVTCLDIDEKKILNLQQGQIPIYEPGLQEMVLRNLEKGRLKFTTDYKAVREADLCFIAVSTPAKENGTCDLSYLYQAADSIAEEMNGYKVIINKSTVPIGTTDEVALIIRKKSAHDFDVVSNPEFLKEGDAINDFMHPDRIIVGVENEKAKKIMGELYANFPSVIFMDVRSSEMTKYAANAMLAARISFMNEIAGLCEILGADIDMVRNGIGTDKRIGPSFLYPGIGYGGSCFPKDIKALKSIAESHGYEMPILQAVEMINERQKNILSKKIISYFADKGGLAGKRVAILGLSFKPGTDDMREAPSINLIRFLLQEGALLQLYDPIAINNAKALFKPSFSCIYTPNPFDAIKNADACVLVTEWKECTTLDPKKIKSLMKGKGFFDGRNQYRNKNMEDFDYFCIGVQSNVLVHD